MNINFYERFQPKNQIKYIEDALFGELLATDGKYTGLLKEHFDQNGGIRDVLFTPSASAALELAVCLLGIKPGDEVVIPSYNFPSAANAVIQYGGIPVLCDIDPVTKSISLEDFANRITKKTKAVIPTHYAGVSCDMDKLMALARENQIAVIEDAAQAVHSLYKGRPLGTIGDFGAYSFHHTKNFSCGEGGAFLCKEPFRMEMAEVQRDNGTNKAQFYRQKTASYSWQCPGSNYMMSEACAALLFAQLQEYQQIIAKRKMVYETYQDVLSEASTKLADKIKLMKTPDEFRPNYHIYYIECRDYAAREIVRKGLRAEGIDARAHFVPLHISDYGKTLGYEAVDFPNSLFAYESLLRLPIHTEMTKTDCERIAEGVIQLAKKL